MPTYSPTPRLLVSYSRTSMWRWSAIRCQHCRRGRPVQEAVVRATLPGRLKPQKVADEFWGIQTPDSWTLTGISRLGHLDWHCPCFRRCHHQHREDQTYHYLRYRQDIWCPWLLRTTGFTTTSLVTVKARFSPMKQLTIPKSELVATQFLARLLVRVAKLLNIPFSDLYAWSDSEIHFTGWPSLLLPWKGSLPTESP